MVKYETERKYVPANYTFVLRSFIISGRHVSNKQKRVRK